MTDPANDPAASVREFISRAYRMRVLQDPKADAYGYFRQHLNEPGFLAAARAEHLRIAILRDAFGPDLRKRDFASELAGQALTFALQSTHAQQEGATLATPSRKIDI